MRTNLSLLFTLLSAMFIFGQDNQSEVNYFTNTGFGNAVTGKAGEYYKGVTYVAYQGALEDPYVVAYNHDKKTWLGPYKAGTSLLGKTKNAKIDNHGKPTLVIDSEGYIHIVYGGHGGTKKLGENTLGNYHKGKQIHVVSRKPMDITSWEVVDNISPFGTYSQFLKMDNGTVYLFYRHGAHRSNWVYLISKDNCRTFSEPVSIVLTKKTKGTIENPEIRDSWYLNFAHGQGSNIVVAYNYHVCKGPHHDGERHNSYYMKFDTDNNRWLNVKGEALKLPITKEYADEMTLVKNTGNNWTHNGTSSIDTQGIPHVSSYKGEDNGTVHGGPKVLQHYFWNGTSWLGVNTGLPVGAKGVMRAESEKNINFLLSYKQDKMSGVKWFNSTDGGQSFKPGQNLILEKGGSFSISDLIRNAHPDARIIAERKIAGTDFVNMYLIGDNGPIKRDKAEADALNK